MVPTHRRSSRSVCLTTMAGQSVARSPPDGSLRIMRHSTIDTDLTRDSMFVPLYTRVWCAGQPHVAPQGMPRPLTSADTRHLHHFHLSIRFSTSTRNKVRAVGGTVMPRALLNVEMCVAHIETSGRLFAAVLQWSHRSPARMAKKPHSWARQRNEALSYYLSY